MSLKRRIVATLPFLLLLGACTEEPKPAAKKEIKPAEPVAALAATYKMYQEARGWAPDCRIERIAGLEVKEVKGGEGKLGAWEVTFISPKLRQSRRFTYSVVEAPSSKLSQGVFGAPAATWSPVGRPNSFAVQQVKTDSPAAYTVAMTKAKAYAAKHPDMAAKFELEWAKRHVNPTWRVYWGEKADASGSSVLVDAALGKYVEH